MANIEVKEIVNKDVVDAVEETMAKPGINIGTGKAIAITLGLITAAVGVGKLIAVGIKSYKNNHELKQPKRIDEDKSEDTREEENDAE